MSIGEDLLSLKDFLRYPEAKPPFEYWGGRAIQKMSPNRPHGLLQLELGGRLNEFVKTKNWGRVYSELRCTFLGGSYVPDLCFIAKGRIPRDANGHLASTISIAPDLAIEILSPGQTTGELTRKLRLALKHGLKVGVLIHPKRKQVSILRPGGLVDVVNVGDSLSITDILPGFSLPLSEMFGWLDED